MPGLTVDVYVNGDLTLEDFAPDTVTDELELPAGDYDIAIFAADAAGCYRRESERHDNVLVEVAALVPPLLAAEGLEVRIGDGFDGEPLMPGLKTIVAHRPPA